MALLMLGCATPAPRVTAVDSLLLLRNTALVATTCLRVIDLRDSLDRERHQRRVQAAQRLDPRVRDSLRNARWTSP